VPSRGKGKGKDLYKKQGKKEKEIGKGWIKRATGRGTTRTKKGEKVAEKGKR